MVHASQTKAKLADSLKDLMKKTPFRKITIQNVTDHCGLNRQTFYYHFKDMYDLLRWIYQNEIFRD
ncbi:MAG TPA: dihydroxyacetone kinase transcriptional activator DhaS, partial [Ruminococcaceae bacterium]|nr:dihydroxyacetone kinase transcriptional activator DhaS [Oscillospiraceae bacterium]